MAYHPPVTRIEVLRPCVEQTVKAFLGVERLEVLEDGTIPIRAGSTAVNVQLIDGPRGAHPLLRVSSPVLTTSRRPQSFFPSSTT